MSDGIQEIRDVFENMGSPVALGTDAEVLSHATGALEAVSPIAGRIGTVWQPRTIDTASGMLRALADIAEIGERRAAEEAPLPSPCKVCRYAGTCGDPPGSDCHS